MAVTIKGELSLGCPHLIQESANRGLILVHNCFRTLITGHLIVGDRLICGRLMKA